jgi:DNA-binding response OmpR family regulator
VAKATDEIMKKAVKQTRDKAMKGAIVKARFLWVDDEMELLKPYVLFLEEKGYVTDCAGSGHDALEMCRSGAYDIVFLDEQMPGLSGLDTLARLHRLAPHLPVVMVTKSEDEGIMNQAIGKKIADYLIKPVNPHQVLSAIKKLLDKKELVAENAATRYLESRVRLDEAIRSCNKASDWEAVYRELVYWELELEPTNHPVGEMVAAQKAEANLLFGRFVRELYERWILQRKQQTYQRERREDNHYPLLSPDLMEQAVFPLIDGGEKLFLILIDNFRYDQWAAVRDIVSDRFTCEESLYFSILPTATQYARNSLFAGLMPAEIAKHYPGLWVDESAPEGKNEQEEQLLRELFRRTGREYSFSYHKVNNHQEGERLLSRFSALRSNDLNIIVFNFIDALSHARSDSKMIRELVRDEADYRALTRSWLLGSPLEGILREIANQGYKAIITTDHGTVRVKNGVTVVGDRETSTNLRYKRGKSLAYDPKRVYPCAIPENIGLPSPHISTRYIFAMNHDFLIYPNRGSHYTSLYENTFQHGGISLEEMIVPLVTLTAK